jgi:hypothetical protein
MPVLSVIEYRHFLNTDSPFIVDIWRRQKPLRAVAESLSRVTLESFVFAKPYFDRLGLILAFEDERPVGFVHAGFGPKPDLTDLDFSVGIVSALRVVDAASHQHISQELLTRACDYLRLKGARNVHFGSRYPHAPFYLGLYGGSQIGGVIEEDVATKEALREFGFREEQKIVTYSRTLAGFRTAVDREQMSIRRKFQISAIADPLETSWWESCTLGLAERDCFHVHPRNSYEVSASVKFWDIQPLATKWGVSARGIHELEISPEHEGTGVELFLLGESLRHLMQQGVGLAEVQCPTTEQSTIDCMQKLCFEKTGLATAMCLKLES